MLTTTTRTGGTRLHTAQTVADFAEACQSILDSHSYAKVNGVTIDSTTAGMVCAVWKALNEKNRIATETFWQKKRNEPLLTPSEKHSPAACAAFALQVKQGGWAVSRLVDLFWKCTRK